MVHLPSRDLRGNLVAEKQVMFLMLPSLWEEEHPGWLFWLTLSVWYFYCPCAIERVGVEVRETRGENTSTLSKYVASAQSWDKNKQQQQKKHDNLLFITNEHIQYNGSTLWFTSQFTKLLSPPFSEQLKCDRLISQKRPLSIKSILVQALGISPGVLIIAFNMKTKVLMIRRTRLLH